MRGDKRKLSRPARPGMTGMEHPAALVHSLMSLNGNLVLALVRTGFGHCTFWIASLNIYLMLCFCPLRVRPCECDQSLCKKQTNLRRNIMFLCHHEPASSPSARRANRCDCHRALVRLDWGITWLAEVPNIWALSHHTVWTPTKFTFKNCLTELN